MKKRFIALLGAGILLLSACASGYTVSDAKKVYEGKSADGYITDTFEHNAKAEEIKVDEDKIDTYVSKYINNLDDEENIKRNTVHKYDSFEQNLLNASLLVSQDLNFNARVEDEEKWAESFGEEFTYEISDGMVSATLSASKTVTNDEDKAAGFSVGYAFTYASQYDKEGLLSSSKLTICIVKTNDKDNKDVAKYQVTSLMSATWKKTL